MVSARVMVIFEVYDEYLEVDHPSGLSEAGDTALSQGRIGDIVEIKRVADD